jgi:hypothetical protein
MYARVPWRRVVTKNAGKYLDQLEIRADFELVDLYRVGIRFVYTIQPIPETSEHFTFGIFVKLSVLLLIVRGHSDYNCTMQYNSCVCRFCTQFFKWRPHRLNYRPRL